MKLKVKKFQEIYEISKLEIDDIDKSILLVACITNQSKEQVENMKLSKFNTLSNLINNSINISTLINDDLKPKKYIFHKRKIYRLNYDLAKTPMNTGRYVEIATYSDDLIANIHKIMATMVTPMKLTWKGLIPINKDKNHKKISEDMLDLRFDIAYQSSVFFCVVFMISIQNSSIYFKSISDKEQVQNLMKNLIGHLGGYSTQRWFQNLKI